MLLKNAESHQRNATRSHRDDRLAGRRRLLVNLGVASESQINRRVIDPDEPLPPTLEEMERHPGENLDRIFEDLYRSLRTCQRSLKIRIFQGSFKDL